MRNQLGLFLSKRAALSPRLEAVVEVERGRRFSYAELEGRSNRVARALRGCGVGRGDRVAVLLMTGVEYVETYFAIAKLGAVMVPLNFRLVADELAFILGDAGARTLVFDAEFEAQAGALRGRTPVEAWIRVGEPDPGAPQAESYAALSEATSPEPVEAVGDEDDVLFIMYTSGTTGLPKGAVHTHGSMIAASTTINMTADMRYRDRYLELLPLFHVGALTPATAAVHRGCTLVLMRSFDPARVFPVIEAEAVTTGLAVPAMLRFMLLAGNHERHDRSQLRWLMSGAAPVPVPLIQAYADLGIEIHQVYGLTESGGPACLISPEEALARIGSTGPAFFHTDVRVVDEADRDVAPGQVGEVIVRGAHLMKGYWNRPEATAETLRDGWLRTGDLATVDKDGFVTIQDRKKDMIISGGENVYPAEVENVLSAHPGVADCAVIGIPSEKWGESPAAVVVAKPDATLTGDDVIAFCENRLARYKIPKRVFLTDEIPRNPTGKVLKRVLRERYPGPAPE